MSFEIEFDSDRNLFVIRLYGVVGRSEFLSAAASQGNHEGFSPSVDTIWDLRYTQAIDVSPNDMSDLIERKLQRDVEMGLTGRIAIVVNRSTVTGAALLTKLRASRSPGRLIEVFQSEKAALSWLAS